MIIENTVVQHTTITIAKYTNQGKNAQNNT